MRSPSARGPSRRPALRVGLAVVALVAAVCAAWLLYRRIDEPTAAPAFYRPPSELPEGSPGTILRSESVQTHSPGEQAWRILYSSTAPDGARIAVSGVVVAPSGDAPPGGWPVLAWAHGTTGIASPCAPSLESDAGLAKVPELERVVASGVVVAVTDYPGLGTPGPHPYLVGESEGRSVLDAARGARSLLGDAVSETTAIYGHSQGGHAALFADALAPTYAPELDVVGVAAMAPPTDLGDLLERDKDEPSGIVLAALAIDSWSVWYPDTDPDRIVHTEARPLVTGIGQRCVTTTEDGISDAPDTVALRARFLSADPADAPGWSERLRENAPRAVPTSIPLLISQGLSDSLVRPDVTEAFVQQECAAGADIELDTYAGVGHFKVRTVAAARVVTWLLDRLQGNPALQGCTTELQQ